MDQRRSFFVRQIKVRHLNVGALTFFAEAALASTGEAADARADAGQWRRLFFRMPAGYFIKVFFAAARKYSI